MKKSIVVFLILLFSTVPTFAQQITKADIQSLKTELTKIRETVTSMDKRLTALEVKVTEMDKRLTTQISELDKRLTESDKRLSDQIASLYTFVRWAIGTLVLVVLAVIALPQVFGYLRDKKERELEKKQREELRKEVEQLKQEVAQLKTRTFTS